MKNLLSICAIALACTFSQTTYAQGILGDILGAVTQTATSQDDGLGSVIGNVLSSVTGSLTTTQANLIGNWTYTSPCVQFESDNLLTQAGGAAMATKCENKLAGYYKIVGIKQGSLKFTFNEDNTCTYTVGKKTLNGTYVFDADAKTVTVKTATGQSVKAYITISGKQMSLCFEADKVFALFTNISSKLGGTLGTIGTLASQYDGMKVGFKFGQ